MRIYLGRESEESQAVLVMDSMGFLAFQDLCFLEAQENDGPLVEAKYKNCRKKMKILLIFSRKKNGLG